MGVTVTISRTRKFQSIFQIYFVKNKLKTILSTVFSSVHYKLYCPDMQWPLSQSKSRFRNSDYLTVPKKRDMSTNVIKRDMILFTKESYNIRTS